MKKYLYNLIYVVANILFTVASFTYTNWILGPDLIGKAQFILTFAQYFCLIAALGIPIYGVVEVAKAAGNKERLSKLFSELVVINLIATLVMLVIYLLIISIFTTFHDDYSLYLIAGGLVFIGFTTIEWLYVGLEQFRFLAVRTLVIRSVYMVALVALVRSEADLLIYLILYSLSIFATNIWYLFNRPGKVRFWFRNLDLKKHIPALMLLFSTTLTISFYTIVDVLLVGFLAGKTEVGLYTAAIKLNKLVIPVIGSLATVLIPGISRSIADRNDGALKKLIDNSFAFICLLGIPVSAGMLVFAPEIMHVFTGPKFAEAIPAMQITAFLAFFIGLGNLFGLQLLIPGGFRKQYMIATLIGVVISLSLNFLLIGRYGHTGAAIAMMATEITVSAVCWYFVRKRYPINFNWMLVLQTIGICLLFVPVAWLLRSWDTIPLVRLIFAVAMCAGLYFAIQIFVLREKHILEIIQRKWR